MRVKSVNSFFKAYLYQLEIKMKPDHTTKPDSNSTINIIYSYVIFKGKDSGLLHAYSFLIFVVVYDYYHV